MRIAATAVALALATLVCEAAATAGPPPRCSLQAWTGHSGVGLGTIYEQYGFLNVGREACVMRGFPAVTMIDASGRAMPTIVRHTRPGAPEFGPVQLITLLAGARAFFIVSFADGTGYKRDRCPTSARLRLTPPGDGRGVVLSGPYGHITPYGGTVQHPHCGIINVGPVRLYTPTNY
jgi:Protein of unknown function (DUF4232)